MITVILADGKVVQCFHVERGVASDLLVQTDTLSFAEAAEIFGNPEALKTITVSTDDEDSVYYGYKTLGEIKLTPAIGDETLMIVLRK